MIRYTAAALFALTASASAARGPLPEVDLEIVGEDASAGVVIERVSSWFQGTKLSSRHLVALDPDAVLAKLGHPGVHVWIVLSDPKHVRIFFAVEDATSTVPRYLMSDVALDDGLDEVGIEQLAQVVFPSANALWMGELETPRGEVERGLEQVTRPSLAPTHRSSVHLALGPEYQVMAEGEGVSQSLGGTATLRGKTLGIRARVAALLPRDASDGGVTVELHGASIGAGAVLAHPIASHTVLLGELGGGVDIVTYRPTMLPQPVLPTSGGTGVQPLVYARAGAGVTLGSYSLAIEAVANVHLRRTHYDVELDGQSRELVVPWLLQPGIAATLTW